MKPTNALFSNVPTTIFATMSALANRHDAINLGQGFPDQDGPDWIKDMVMENVEKGPNQYPPMMGLPALREAVAHSNKRFYGLDVDAEKEVLVTSGATEALMDSCLALINPGDEAIVIEPYYDCYVPQIKAAGGIPKFVRLSAPDWQVTEELLRPAFSDKTKLIILNTPMNPAAKVFSKDELSIIAKLLIEFDAYAVCDEVYEHLVFDDKKHIPLMALDGMRERCVRIGSAGKTFSFTGWKIGYVTAAPHLLGPIASAHQFVTFTTPPVFQYPIARGLLTVDDYFHGLVAEMDKGRQQLSKGLQEIGFGVLPCEGTYFLTVDISPLNTGKDDVDFCEWITKEAKVAAIPMSVFYNNDGENPPPKNLARFCFAKREEILSTAILRLKEFL